MYKFRVTFKSMFEISTYQFRSPLWSPLTARETTGIAQKCPTLDDRKIRVGGTVTCGTDLECCVLHLSRSYILGPDSRPHCSDI